MVFDSDGLFVRNELDASGAPSSISIDLEDLATDPNLVVAPDFSQVTQFAASESTLDVVSQDGSPAGTLQGFTVSVDGTVVGIYSNGVTRPVGAVALASFTNPEGLLADGNNLFREGPNSGLASIGRPQSGELGIVRSGTLEMSNVDLAKEFTDLIVTQRAFQANARTIAAADEMLTELLRTV
jgi:flagellar hook protein FlgE